MSSPTGDRTLGKYAYTLRMIPLKDIVPSPFQHRTEFNPETLKELARSVTRDGLMFPIIVRPAGDRFELIAGERRFRAARDYTDMETIEAKVVEADDIGAQNLSDAENELREDLSIFETIEKTVAIVDSQLSGDHEYDAMGAEPVDRVVALLTKLHAATTSRTRGSVVSKRVELLSNKFVRQVHYIFHNLSKPLKWQSFYNNDLKLLVETDQKGEIRKSAVGSRACPPPVRHRLRLRRAGRVASYVAQASRAGVGCRRPREKGLDLRFAIADS